MPSQQVLKNEALKLIDFVSTCTRTDGLLCGWVDPIKNQHDPNHLLSDFGDWAPFFLYFERPELVDKHLQMLSGYLLPQGVLRPIQKRLGVPVLTAFEQTDLLLGLLDCIERPHARQLAQKMARACINFFKIGNRGLYSYYIPPFLRIPITSSVDATFIELLTQAGLILEDSYYIDTAEELSNYFLETNFFKKHHLFPELSGVAWGPRTRRAQTMKHNTNTVSGLLDLYQTRPTDDILTALQAWIVATDQLIDSSGYASFGITESKNSWIREDADIVPSVGLLDVLCDCAYYLKSEEALARAQALGSKLLKLQDTKTDLVRRSPTNKKTHLDAQTDLIIAWEKLSAITGTATFHEAALKLFNAIRTYHKYGEGFIFSCDSTNGDILDYLYNTRYNSLLLKAYIFYLNGQSMYSDLKLVNLLKDR